MLSSTFELSFSFFRKGPQTELQSRMEHVDLHPDDDDECIPKLPEFFQDPPSPTYDTPPPLQSAPSLTTRLPASS